MKNRKKFCHLCGGTVAFGEVAFSFGARAVCSDCANAITVEDLIYVTGAKDCGEMLTALGFDRGVLF
ncbi:MAG: hypothetical protein IKC75_01105 [Clostridia bacterium]|nr:hypothetical protein [Clostridia bacterium]